MPQIISGERWPLLYQSRLLEQIRSGWAERLWTGAWWISVNVFEIFLPAEMSCETPGCHFQVNLKTLISWFTWVWVPTTVCRKQDLQEQTWTILNSSQIYLSSTFHNTLIQSSFTEIHNVNVYNISKYSCLIVAFIRLKQGNIVGTFDCNDIEQSRFAILHSPVQVHCMYADVCTLYVLPYILNFKERAGQYYR